MAEENTTFAEFLDSSLRPVLSTRPYLLNKPCSLCHSETNIRVHKQNCSHRVCSTCLAQLETRRIEGSPTKCPICSTYWFTLQSGPCHTNHNILGEKTDLSSHIAQRSKEIEFKICGASNIYLSLIQTSDNNTVGIPGHSPNLLDDSTITTRAIPDSSPGSYIEVHDSNSMGNLAELEVLMDSGSFGSSLIANNNAVEASTTQLKHSLQLNPSRMPNSETREATNTSISELETTEICSGQSHMAEKAPLSSHPTDSSQRASLNATPNSPESITAQQKRESNMIWPVLLLIVSCFALECVRSAIIKCISTIFTR